MNREGQLCGILQSEFPESAPRLVSVAQLDGMPLTAQWVQEQVSNNLGELV
jgi:2-oxoglutarate ferredoxin oxidoreductase subunit alpha